MEIIFFLTIILLNVTFFFNLGKLSKFVNIYDIPDFKRKIHKKKTPQIGGIIFFFNFCLYLLFDKFFFKDFEFLSYNVILISSSCIFFLGLFDDKYNLGPKIKSLIFITIFFLTVYFENSFQINRLSFSINSLEFNLSKISIYFTIFCLFLFINAFNMYDGINGNAGLYIIIIFSYFIFKNIYIYLSISLIITSIFFLFFNFNHKIFLGDSGSILMSFVISLIMIIKSYDPVVLFADEIFILMMLPGIDMARLFIIRIYKRRNPLVSDSNHIHHILTKKLNLIKYTFINLIILILPIILFIYGVHSIFIIFLSITIYSILIYFFQN